MPFSLSLTLFFYRQTMATTSLNLLHLPFSKSPPSSSFSSRQVQVPHHFPLKSQTNNGNSLVCNSNNDCYNVEVMIDDDESTDMYLRFFERDVARSGIPREWRRRMFFESIKEERKRKARDRGRSRRRRRAGARGRGNWKESGGGGDEEPEEEDPTGALSRLMDPEYQEGNIEVLDEGDFPDTVWDDDGNGQFSVFN
ncbi:30S ribosomal protein S21 [Rhynchospora pubera]|uniref:30S ribosomal protein S21 n=1 Tax=Rhynchospora pubera TaxID=906938 RepID=A0AAV8H4B6_9POAL|nr:30S ribosomal protein S21 [Rhynchospora pubera]